MTNSDLDEIGQKESRTNRDMSLMECLQVLKGRAVRLYGNLVKAINDEGPNYLHPHYSKFEVSYDVWKDMRREERVEYAKKFLTFVPEEVEPSTSRQQEVVEETGGNDGSGTSEFRDPLDDPPNQTPAATATLEESVAEKPTLVDESAQTLPIRASYLMIPESGIKRETLRKVFRDAQAVLNESDSISCVPSSSKNCRTVRNETDVEPLIVKPNSRNQNLFLYKCRRFVSLSVICHHTAAVSHVVGKLLEYCMEVKKKLTASQAKRKTAYLTAGMENNLHLSHRGKKQTKLERIH